jgi:hypothetical protein
MLNKKTYKDSQGKFHKGMDVIVLTHGSEIWTLQKEIRITNRNCWVNLLWNVAGYTGILHRSN